MRHCKYTLLIILLAFYQLSLIGCSVEPVKPTIPDIATPEQEIDRLYQLARQARSPSSEAYRLAAVELLIQLNRQQEASEIFSAIPEKKLPNSILAQYAIVGAKLALSQFNAPAALHILSQHEALIANTSTEKKIQAARFKAQAYDLEGWPIEGAMQLIQIAPHLTGSGAIENKETLWQMLMKASPSELTNRLEQTKDNHIIGWLQLALLTRTNQEDLDLQLSALNEWLDRWQTHPGAANLPDELKILSTIITERPQHITLMLPLEGPNAAAGKAVRDGFFAAYYSAHTQNSQTPTITVMDTSNTGNILELYDSAVAQGSELIIGPLQKNHVQALQQQPDLMVPTLALNYSTLQKWTPGLYQFGLSAEDEARQVAHKAWQDGRRRSLVLAPDSEWGKRIVDAFEIEWRTLSGTVLEIQYFNEDKSYSTAIQELLNIDESERRAQRLQSLTSSKIEFTPRRRADIDFIFIAASPKQARQIKPTLAFHFAGAVPVYSTSHIFSGLRAPLLDRDLDEIIFCETPWMLEQPDNTLKIQIKQTWPATANHLGRLYALGVDAYRLFPRIKQLARIQNSKLDGLTGSLNLDQQGRVMRTLKWARFENGEIQPLN